MKGAPVAAALAVAASFAAEAVTLDRGERFWKVSNAWYELEFDKANGGVFSSVKYPKGPKFMLGGGLVVTADGQPESRSREHERKKPTVQRTAKDVKMEVFEESAAKIVVSRSFPLIDGQGDVAEVLTFDDTPAVAAVYDLRWKKRMNNICFSIGTLQFSEKTAVMYPEVTRPLGTLGGGPKSRWPGWKYFSDGKRAFGIAIAPDSGWDQFERFIRENTEQWKPSASIAIRNNWLSLEPREGSKRFSATYIFTADAKTAGAIARQACGKAPRVQLTDIIPDKVHVRVGGRQGATLALVSNSDRAEKVKVSVEAVSGLGRTSTVAEEEVLLKAGEIAEKHWEWTFPKNVEWGVTTRISVRDSDGRLLDSRSDVTSVGNFAPAITGFGILNPGMAWGGGAEKAFADSLKNAYIGIVEYYCWMPATWDPERKAALTPAADEWEPNTESNTHYRRHLKKSFVKNLVRECHEDGVHVYAMLTGLCNYQAAMAHPEMFLHTKDGQLCIYGGKFWGPGERFATAKLCPYSPKDAAEWGDQFADSIDMFGWDGCRFDWGFMPHAPNDPLYDGDMSKAKDEFIAYDWRGRSMKELYPDNDEAGYQALKAWREAVEKRHPEFIYAANGWATDVMFKKLCPKYSRLASTRSIRLTEYLSSITSRNPTYKEWAAALIEDGQNVRKCGGQTIVGFMRRMFNGSYNTLYARMVCVASGSKWMGAPGEERYWTSPYRSSAFAIRFCEYFWNNEFIQVPASLRTDEVQVKSAAKVFWEPFVYERKTARGRETLVHVVNVAPELLMTPYQPKNPDRTDIRVVVKPRKGERLVSATALLPGDEPRAASLEFKGNVVKLPRLEEAASVVLGFAK